MTIDSATLNGDLTGLGTASSVEVIFEYGTTTSYGQETTPQTLTSTGVFSAPISALTQGTTYHFRAKAVGDSTVFGSDKQFITLVPSPPKCWNKYIIESNLASADSVFVYDIDGDANPDIVAAGKIDNDIVWYEAPDDPTQPWAKHTIDGNLAGASGVYVYDMDGDGDPDVCATGRYAKHVVWYEAPDDPTQSWPKHIIDANLSWALHLYVADIDGDGNPDVVATGWDIHDVVWYEAPDDPTQAWIKHIIDPNMGYASCVFVYDIDGDSNPDVVATGYNGGVAWYEAADDPTQAWTKHSIDAGLWGARGVFVYDIDGDSNPDIVAAGWNDNEVAWYEAPDNPTQPWTKHNIYPSTGQPAGIFVYDMDADTNPDIVATMAGGDKVLWYEAPDDPTHAWTVYTIDPSIDGPVWVDVHDIDGDGYPNVVVAATYDYDVVWYDSPAGTAVSTATDTGCAAFDTSSGILGNLVAVSESSMPSDGKPTLEFPHGFFEFQITGLSNGEAVTLSIDLPHAVPTDTQYWKYGPTTGTPTPHWYQIAMGDNDGDSTITITLIDGGLGDDDLIANGVIIDQGGPGNPPATPAAAGAGVPVFPSLYYGIVSALGAAILAFYIHRRLVHQE